jgi:hypothetical protein
VNVDVAIPCGAGVHRVLFRRGNLVLVDHDVAAEATVAALGGTPPPCFDVFRSWRARDAWERALEPRGPGFHQLYRRPPLPAPLQLPLEAGIVRGWERRRARGDRHAGAMLTTAVHTKGEAALAAALRKVARGRVERCAVEIGASPSATGRITSTSTTVTVRVTDDWWRTVGLPGAALDEHGRFVLAVRPKKLVLDWQERSPGRWSPVVAETR